MTKNHRRLCFHMLSLVPRRCKGFVLTDFHTIRRTFFLPFLPVDVPSRAIGGRWLPYFRRRSQIDEVCVPTAPSSWCFLKSEAVTGHLWLCPCLKPSLSWFHSGGSGDATLPLWTTLPTGVSGPPTIPTCTLPKMPLSQFLFLWHSSILRKVSWLFLRLENAFLCFPFFFPLTQMSGLYKRQNQGGTGPLAGLFPTPVGQKCCFFHKQAHSWDYFVSQSDLSGLKTSESLTIKPKLPLLGNLLIFFSDFKLLLGWICEGPKSLYIPLDCCTAMHSFLLNMMWEEPEGHTESLLRGGLGNTVWPNSIFLGVEVFYKLLSTWQHRFDLWFFQQIVLKKARSL